METAEYGKAPDGSGELRRSRNGLLLGESLVRARVVVEARELGHETSHVPLTEDENVVEQLAS